MLDRTLTTPIARVYFQVIQYSQYKLIDCSTCDKSDTYQNID